MASRAKTARRKTTSSTRSAKAGRSADAGGPAKAGRPPKEPVLPPRVRRRQKSAIAVVNKATTLQQAAEGPRAAWPASRPMFKKG